MANKTIRDFHGSFNVSESYTTYKSEDQIDEATPPSGPKATRSKDEKTPPSGPKNPNKPHVKTPAPTYVRNKPRYSRYTGSSRRGMIDDEGYRSDGSNPVDDAIRRRNAARRRAAARNEEITVGEELGITEGDKSEYSKLMKQYGDMPMSKVPMKTRLKIRELGRKVRGDKPVSGLRASDLVDDMKRRQMGEASFMVDIEGIGKVVIDGTSAAEIKTSLRKVLRKKDMIGDVERVGVSAKKKHFMMKAKGEEEEIEEARGSDYKLYHKSYTDAVKHAFAHHAKSGLRSSDDDRMHHIGLNSKKPGEGKTTSVSVPATHKSGKKHQIHIQVYNKGGSHPYELNTYSSTHRSMQEAKGDSTSATIKVSGGDAVEIGMVKRGGKMQYYWKAKSGLKNVFDSPEKLRYSLRNTANFSGAEKAVAQLQKVYPVNEAKNKTERPDPSMKRFLSLQKQRDRLLAKGELDKRDSDRLRHIKKEIKSRSAYMKTNEEIEQVDEAKMGAIANAARKGMPPYTIVAIQGLNPPKVVAQETTMIASAVPAHVKEMKSKYPKAKISVEGKSGKILHTEQVEESMIGRTKPSRELNVQKFEKKYLGTKSLKDAKRAAHKAERKKEKMDIQKGD